MQEKNKTKKQIKLKGDTNGKAKDYFGLRSRS